MYVHKEKRLVFLANPRTASRATAKALLERGFTMMGTHHSGYGEIGGRSRECPFRTFATVRDPDEIEASWARHLSCSVEDVPELMERQRPIIAGWTDGYLPHLWDADILLHYANLDDELNALLAMYGIDQVTLERIG